jgi:hypothetical protein
METLWCPKWSSHPQLLSFMQLLLLYVLDVGFSLQLFLSSKLMFSYCHLLEQCIEIWWFFLVLWILAIFFRKPLKLQFKILYTEKRLLCSFLDYQSRQVMLFQLRQLQLHYYNSHLHFKWCLHSLCLVFHFACKDIWKQLIRLKSNGYSKKEVLLP